MRFTKSLLSAVSLGAVTLGLTLPGTAHAQESWQGFSSSNWTDPTNWDNGTTPTAVDPAVVDGATPHDPEINGSNASALSLTVGQISTGSLAIRNGGVLFTGGGSVSVVGSSSGSSGYVSIDGLASAWMDSSDVVVGLRGSGTIEVTNQGTLGTRFLSLGRDQTGSGLIIVQGPGSSLHNQFDIDLGMSGGGEIDILGGASVSSQNLVMGGSPTGAGQVFISGAGSSLTVTSSIEVGRFGSGALTISNGGMATANHSTIAGEAGSSGTVTVDGAGSSWINVDYLQVGSSGSALLDVRNGGLVANGIGVLGVFSGSEGTAMISGTGSRWSNSDALYVGSSGHGSLAVLSGGEVTSTNGFVGFNPDGTGSVAVDGTGSHWTMTGNLHVGSGGTGEMLITGGGRVTNATGWIGFNPGSNGAVTVDGTGSNWTNNQSLFVGQQGSGTLHISGGGSVNAFGLVAGNLSGSLGMIDVMGAGSLLSTGLLSLGQDGQGQLLIGAGGRVQVNNAQLGFGSGAIGSAYISGAGSRLEASGTVMVGASGRAGLTIADGGMVIDGMGIIGRDAGSDAAVTVDGAGSLWQNGSSLFVGISGSGRLSVSNGGSVTSASGVVGSNAGGFGNVRVGGAGSNWTLTGDLAIGEDGNGALAMFHGGTVSSANVTAAHHAGSSAVMEIENAGTTLNVANTLTIGDAGFARMAIRSGAHVNSLVGVVGGSAGGRGDVTVTGAGSLWNNSGQLIVGNATTGTLAIDSGGTVVASAAAVGQSAGVGGSAVIDGIDSSLQVSGNMTLGGLGNGMSTVRNGGILNVGGTLRIADAAGSTGRLIIGADEAETAAAVGIVNAGAIQFGAGDGLIVFNHTSSAYTFAGSISGSGSLRFLNGTTILTGNSSAYNGQAALLGGTLVVNGSLGQALATDPGTRLMGTGTIGGAFIGGVVAPGNSIGTLNFGNASLLAGSTYEVEVTPGGLSDLIAATGNVTIDGATVRVMNPVGTYALGTRYTIITTGGNVIGTFSGLSVLNPLPTPFINFALSYAPKAVYLDVLRSSVTFTSVGGTFNQKATGAGLDSLPQSGPLISALVQLTGPQAAQAYDQLSGEVHASAKTALVEDSRFIRGAVGERVRMEAEEGNYLWGFGFGSWGHADSDGNAARLDRSTGGALIGYDGQIGESWRAGVLAGWSRSNFDIPARASEGHANSIHLGLYGNGRWDMGKGEMALRMGLSYSWHKLETDRVAAFPGFADALTANYKARSVLGFAELGYAMKRGSMTIEPYAGLSLVSLQSMDFQEIGGTAALAGTSQTDGFVFGNVGLRSEFALGAKGTFRLGGGWRHLFGDTAPLSAHAFAGGSKFDVAGAPIARDQAEIEAGVDFEVVRNVRIGVSYGGQFGKGASDHSGRASLSIKL